MKQPGLWMYLRFLERGDPAQDRPPDDGLAQLRAQLDRMRQDYLRLFGPPGIPIEVPWRVVKVREL